MKKRLAWALAALLMLVGCCASAEWANAFPAITITGELTLDLDATREALSRAGVPSDQIDRWNALLSLLNGTRDALVIADEGIEYRAEQPDGEALTIAGESRDGHVRIVSSLFPNYCVTGAASGIAWQAVAAASDAVVEALNQTMDAVAAAVKPEVPTFGRYEIDGESFDMRTALHIDAMAMAEAGVTLLQSLLENETLRAAGLDALPDCADIRVEPSALPIVTAARYDADGKSATLYNAKLTVAGEAPLTVATSVRMDGGEVRVKVGLPDRAIALEAAYVPDAGGANLRADVQCAGTDYALTVDVRTGETVTMTTVLCADGNRLATEVNTFALTGARAMAVETGGKTELDIQDVLNNAEGAGTKLLMNMVTNGLPALIGLLDK